ncbi:MAG: IclR family transcriptional regulator [Puniceicoccaceae bacterium]
MARTRKPESNHFNMGIRILECLVNWPTSRGVTQLAEELDLAPSSTHDLLKVLCELGFAIHDPTTRRYAPSPRIFEFIHHFSTQFGITPKVQELIHKRSTELQLSIFLGTAWQNESYVVCTSGPLAGGSSLGSHGPIVHTAIGKALIATYMKDDWETYATYYEELEYSDSDPDKAREAFLKELERISESGVAWNLFHTDSDVFSVAAPLSTRGTNRKYAVALVFTKAMYHILDRSKMEETVKEIATEVEDAISF